MRSLSYVVLPLVLALALVLVTRSGDTGTFLSSAHIGLGAEKAAAAGAPPAAQKPATTSGAKAAAAPAANKGDGEDFDLRHAPSIDAAGIAEVLRSYGSPAVEAAGTMYNLGVQYGIDPAFCLAFFIQESTAGTQGVARVTKSVGNIRTTPGYRDYQGYRHYATWEEGIADWYQLISELYINTWGLTTVDAIIPVYAPSSDNNNPSHYAATVKKLVAGWRAPR